MSGACVLPHVESCAPAHLPAVGAHVLGDDARELGQRYARYFNRRYARTGTLWEGRYRSCLVETARYVIGCYRYVEMNPVPLPRLPGTEVRRLTSVSGKTP